MNTPHEQLNQEPLTDVDVLRNGIHILASTLLVVSIFSSVRMPIDQAFINLILLSAFAGVYFGGSLYVDRWHRGAQWLWILVLTGLWGIDLFIAPAGIYLVFVLFFLYLRVLDMSWGIFLIIFTTSAAIGAQLPNGLTFGGVMGPVVSALVTVAIHVAFTTLQRMNNERGELIEELIETRSLLADTERKAGINDERQRIAHEIHDTLAQGLSSIQMLLHAADRDLESEEKAKAQQRIALARSTAADNLQEARAMIAALQPVGLSETSLSSALTRMTEGFAATGGLTIDVDAEGAVRQLPMKVEAALLRIAQGAVGNVVKHAQASRARVTVTYEDDEVRLDVVDNGVGFDVAEVQQRPAGLGHIGLSALSRRAEELAGEVIIDSAPDEGTAVSVSIPLEREDPSAAETGLVH